MWCEFARKKLGGQFMKRKLLALVLLMAASCVSLWSQAVSVAQISGTVQDATGAAIPGAQVKVTQTDTGASRTTESGPDGVYILPSLPIGPYRLEVSKDGFSTYNQSGIVLQVNTNPTINISLRVGAVTEHVEVQASAAMVETQTTGIGQVVDSQRVVELPLNGRQATDLIYLAGAAVTAPAADLSSGKNYPGPAVVSVGGGASNGMTYVLDGGTHNDPFNNLNLPLPFPDALQEFKVETSALPAQYGHHSAAAVNAVTKGGTNAFHGDAFEFVRNYVFNARNIFEPTRNTLKRNQFGGTLGGRIIKDKLFFFAGYQGTEIRALTAPATANIPTADMLRGDFRNIASPQCNAGRQITLKAPFVGNQIDPLLLDSAAVKMQSYFTLPTDSICGQTTYQGLANQSEQMGVYKIDYQVSEKQTIFLRHFITHALLPSPYNGTQLSLSTPTSGADDLVNSGVFGDTYVLGPRVVNSFRATYNRASITKFQVPIFTPADLGIAITPNIPNHIRVAAGTYQSISVFGYPSYVPTNSYQFSDDMNVVRGKHQIGFGFNYIRAIQNMYNLLDTSGSFTFTAQNTGLIMGDYFTGQPSTFTEANIAQDHARTRYFGLYLQDNWRVTNRLTIAAGLRWDPYFGTKKLRDNVLHFDMAKFIAGTHSTIYKNAPAGLMFPGDPGFESGDKTSNNDLANFAPRLGIVWDPKGDGKTSIRASWGMFYDLPHTLFFYVYSSAPPWGNRVTLTNPAGGFKNPWLGFPGGNPFPSNLTPDFNFPSGGSYATNNFNLHTTYLEQWNISIQRQLARDWMVSANYMGNNTIHLWTNTDLNPAVYQGSSSTTGNTAARRVLTLINPTQGAYYSSLPVLDDGGTGSYNALLLSVNKRLAQNYTISANYTLSHCISDLVTSEFRNTLYLDPTNRRYDRSNCSTGDRRHLFNLSAVASTPKFNNRALQAIAGNWRVSGIFRVQAGPYLNILSGVDSALNGIASQRVNLLRTDPVAANPTADQYFNSGAFGTPTNGTFGNIGPYNVLGRGQFNLDMGITRSFRIKEGQSLEVRGEAFQILNHPILQQPNVTFNSTSFGKTTTAIGERIMQFAIKYTF
jgi:hypothetical protein